MSHTSYLLQVTWTRGERRIQAQTIDRVNPSPRNPPSTHVLLKEDKWSLIERLTARHVASWEAPDRHQSKALSWSRSDGWSSSRDDRHQTAGGGLASWSWRTGSVNRNRSSNWSLIGRFKGFVEELHDRSPIAPRPAIGKFMWWNRLQSIGGWLTTDQDHDRGLIAARSWLDCGPIVAWSWVYLKQKLRLICHKIEATIVINWSSRPPRPIVAINPSPRSHQTA